MYNIRPKVIARSIFFQKWRLDYVNFYVFKNVCRINFAQWRYTNQWPFREVVLLLVENWIPIPRLKDVKYHLSCQFLMVLLGPNNGDTSTYIVTPQRVCTYTVHALSTHHGGALLSTINIRGPSLVQEKKSFRIWDWTYLESRGQPSFDLVLVVDNVSENSQPGLSLVDFQLNWWNYQNLYEMLNWHENWQN